MTNTITLAIILIATQTTELKTNVTESFIKPGMNFTTNWPDIWSPRVEPKDKWVTTIVQQETRLHFEWMGAPREIVSVIPLSTNIVHLRRKEEWEPAKP